MQKSKKSSTKKAAKSSRAKPASPFAVGDRVQVLSGDHGNARGSVLSAKRAGVCVRLDSEVHKKGGVVFDAKDLLFISAAG